MLYQLGAWAVLLSHLGFILFAALGALLVSRWPKLALAHVPAAAWAIYVEWSGRICPLTYWENTLRLHAGQSGYTGGFIEHYLLATIYPEGLTRNVQFLLGGLVLALNAVGYGWAYWRWKRRKALPQNQPPFATNQDRSD